MNNPLSRSAKVGKVKTRFKKEPDSGNAGVLGNLIDTMREGTFMSNVKGNKRDGTMINTQPNRFSKGSTNISDLDNDDVFEQLKDIEIAQMEFDTNTRKGRLQQKIYDNLPDKLDIEGMKKNRVIKPDVC